VAPILGRYLEARTLVAILPLGQFFFGPRSINVRLDVVDGLSVVHGAFGRVQPVSATSTARASETHRQAPLRLGPKQGILAVIRGPIDVESQPGFREKRAMKDLIKQYLEHGISRRSLMRGLGAAGLSGGVAKSIIDSLTISPAMAQEAAASGAIHQVRGNGGAIYMQQLKSAGVKYVFFNPSTGDAPFYDALVDIPEIQLIKGVQEGAVVAMADGYARLSGEIGVAHIANVGLPNGMTQLVNSYKDHIPVMLTVAAFGTEVEGRDYAQDYEHQEQMMAPITKNWWLAESTADIADVTRRVMKFAMTRPSGPVFLSIPDDLLRAQATAQVYDASLFNVSMKIRPDHKDVQTVAKMLIESKNPLLSVGDEITQSHAEAEVVELAELLGLTVCGQAGQGNWSKPFPTRNPLYIGAYATNMRFPGQVDVHINIGDQAAERTMKGATLISMRHDPTGLARVWPVDLGMVCDIKLGVADLIAAVKSMATKERLKQIADSRTGRVHDHSAAQAKMRQTIAADLNNGSSIKMERLGVELESHLDKDAIYVSDCDSGRTMDPLISWGGGGGRSYISTGPNILGWGIAAATGAKLAQPNRPVVSCVGDGSCMFGGPQPLWSQARYKSPVTNVVVNNKSYNNERNRIWSFIAGQQFKMGKDMTCYNGDPDVDFAKAALAFGVEAEVVSEPDKLKPAFARAKKANYDGRPYLLDIHVDRDGVGAESAWHPPFSIADQRTRKV
jgi:thiamine pyrophosphate-dependent acetolactate synthase large subunit-like protein